MKKRKNVLKVNLKIFLDLKNSTTTKIQNCFKYVYNIQIMSYFSTKLK